MQLPKGVNKLKITLACERAGSEVEQQVIPNPQTPSLLPSQPTARYPFSAPHPRKGLSKQDVKKNLAWLPRESLPQSVVAGGLGSLMWYYTCFTPCLAREISHSLLQKNLPIPATFKSMSFWVKASAKSMQVLGWFPTKTFTCL